MTKYKLKTRDGKEFTLRTQDESRVQELARHADLLQITREDGQIEFVNKFNILKIEPAGSRLRALPSAVKPLSRDREYGKLESEARKAWLDECRAGRESVIDRAGMLDFIEKFKEMKK